MRGVPALTDPYPRSHSIAHKSTLVLGNGPGNALHLGADEVLSPLPCKINAGQLTWEFTQFTLPGYEADDSRYYQWSPFRRRCRAPLALVAFPAGEYRSH